MDIKKIIPVFAVVIVLVISALVNQIHIGGQQVDLGSSASNMLATAGCKYVDRTETTNDSFTCIADECEVSGTIVCDTQGTAPKVKLRCGDGWFDWDKDNNGQLLHYTAQDMAFGGTGSMGLLISCPNSNYGVYQYLGWITYATSSDPHQRVYSGGGLAQITPLAGYETKEVYSQESGYSCSWKLCHVNDPNWKYCTLTESYRNSWTLTSSAKMMRKGEQITFMPVDSKNARLPAANKMIVSNNYDCSCLSECKIGAKKCTPGVVTATYCDNSYNLGAKCAASGCTNCVAKGYGTATCAWTYQYDCVTTNKDYKTCDLTSSCNDYVTAGKCTGNLICGAAGTGDECICPSGGCVLGTTKCYSDLEYQTCAKDSSGCPAWGTIVSCPQGLGTTKCNAGICQPQNQCAFAEKKCTSQTTIKECKTDSTTGAKYWGNPRNCGSNTNEPTNCITENGVDKCGCANEVCQSVSEIQCGVEGTNQYKSCIIGADGCYAFEPSSAKNCGTTSICQSNKCVSCADSNVCTKDYQEANVCKHDLLANCCVSNDDCSQSEECSANQCIPKLGFCTSNAACTGVNVCDTTINRCVCPSTGDWCPKADEFQTKCGTQSTIMECRKDSATSCYKWVSATTCTAPEICTQNSPAKCTIPGNMYFRASGVYPINKPISIPIEVKDSVGDVSGNAVYAIIYDSSGNAKASAQCILSKNLLTGVYSCSEEFTTPIQLAGDYKVVATLQPSNLPGISLTTEWPFKVYMGVGVNIISKSIVYTGSLGIAFIEVKDELGNPIPMCSQTTTQQCFERWRAEPKVNNQAVNYNLVSTVEAGKVQMTYSLPSAGSVSIKAWTDGGQLVSTSAERTDIIAQAPAIILEQDIPSTVNYGTNRFTFKTFAPTNNPDLDREALDIDANSISVKVDYPDSHSEVIHPTKQGKGDYFFSLAMPKENGDHYTMTITATYSNWLPKTTPLIHINAQSATVEPVSGTDFPTYIIAGLAVLLVVVLIIVGVFRRRR